MIIDDVVRDAVMAVLYSVDQRIDSDVSEHSFFNKNYHMPIRNAMITINNTTGVSSHAIQKTSDAETRLVIYGTSLRNINIDVVFYSIYNCLSEAIK